MPNPSRRRSLRACARPLLETRIVGLLQGHLQAGREIPALVNDLAGRAHLQRRLVGHGVGGNQVSTADIRSIDVELTRDRVQHALHRETSLGVARAPHRGGRDLVGLDRRHAQLVVRQDVGTWNVRRGVIGDVDPLKGVSPGVADHRPAHAAQLACVVETDFEIPVLIAFLDRSHQVLAPVFDPFDRATEQHAGSGNRHFLRIKNKLAAEAAAHVGRDDANAIFIETEHLHDEEAGLVGELGRTPDRQHVHIRLVVGEDAAALDRMRPSAVLLQRQLQAFRRSADRGVGVPVLL